MAGSTYTWNGGTGSANTPTNWTPNGVPNSGDTAIALSGDVILPVDAQLNSNRLEGSNVTLTFVGDLSTNFGSPTTDPTTVITDQVSGVATPETTVLDSAGVFVNQGNVIADGPAGSTLTVNISANGTVPGYFFNTGTMIADAGNTLIVNVGSASVLFNTGSIVADGGTVEIAGSPSAITGGYGPVRGFGVIESGGTLEINAATALITDGGTGPYFDFADSTPGNSLIIGNIGSFDGRIAGFAAGDTIDLGSSLAVGTLVYQANDSFLYLENNAGHVLASLIMSGPFASGTFALSGGAADGFVIGTGADGNTILTSTVTNTVASGISGSWQSSSSWANGTVPSAASDPLIGQGATADFTLNTGGSSVSVGGLILTSPQATLEITSNTTATSQTINDFAGTLDVTAGNTLTGSALQTFSGSSAVTIAAGAVMDLSGRGNPNLAAVAGDWTLQSGDTFAVTVSAGTLEVDGSLLAGPPTPAGGGGSVSIGSDSSGQPASITVNTGGTVTDTRTLLGSDPTSFGVLTLNGAGANWTDETDAADPLNSRGYLIVGYNDLASNTPSGFADPPSPAGAAQVLIENGATLTDQVRAYIADSPDSAGTVSVTSGGLWSVGFEDGGFVEVGASGQGALSITNNGTVEIGNTGTFLTGGTTATGGGIGIGYTGGSGTVTVASGGLLMTEGGVGVGHTAQGTLDIQNGGTVDVTAHGVGVGQDGNGFLEVQSGGTLIDTGAGSGFGIGQTLGVSGTLLITGPGALVSEGTATTGMSIGQAGTGLLDIESGGVVSVNSSGSGISLGQTVGATGTIVVDGTSSLLSLGTLANALNVGVAGTGTLLVENGGELAMNGTNGIGAGLNGATGSITVTNSGTLLSASGLFIGNSGTGALNITGAGTADVTGRNVVAGVNSGSSGSITVSGANSVLTLGTSSTGLSVGQFGKGLLQITSGGAVIDNAAQFLAIGQNGNSTGTVVVTGASSLLTFAPTSAGISVGTSGQGTLVAENQGDIVTTNIALGGSISGPVSGHGTVEVIGSGSIEATNIVAVWAGSTLSVDSTSSLVIGTSGSAPAGEIEIENGHTLLGSGLVNAAINNVGTILAVAGAGGGIPSPGTLELTSGLTGNGVLAMAAGGILRIDNALPPVQTISFGSGGGELIAPGANISNAITGLNIGDKIEFNFLPGTTISSASVTSPGTVTVFTNTGSVQLTDVSFAAGSSTNFSTGTDPSAGGIPYIQVIPLFFNWTGAASTDYGTAGNWQSDAVPNASDSVSFINDPGTVTGTGSALSLNIGNYNTITPGTWTFQGATITVAGQPSPPFLPYGIGFNMNAVISSGTLNTSGGDTNIGGPGGVTVTAEGGAQVTTLADNIGTGSGQSGTLVVTGAGTDWTEQSGAPVNGTTPGYLTVGFGGPSGTLAASSGFLVVTNGASLNTGGFADFGGGTGSSGSGIVSAGGVWTALAGLSVGNQGVGTLAVNGGTVSAAGIFNVGASNGSVGTVSVTAGGQLTTQSALNVGSSGSGTLAVNGGTVTDNNTFVAGANVGSFGTVTVTNGDLSLHSTVIVGEAGSGAMSIQSGATVVANSLTIGAQSTGQGTVSVSGAGSLLDVAGTMFVGTTLGIGDLTIGPAAATATAATAVLKGEVAIGGGELNAPQIDIIIGGTLLGSGSFGTPSGLTLNGGTIDASNGTLIAVGTIGGAGSLLMSNASTLEVSGSVAGTQSVVFTTPSGALILEDIGGFGGTIAQFAVGDTIYVDTTTPASFVQNGSIVDVITSSTTLGALTFANTSLANTAVATPGALVDVTPCFVAGTRIATERGEVAVEDLTVGDRVQVVGGIAQPTIWLGHRTVQCARHPQPERVWPVRIAAGAFGANRPYRDLWLSPDHAVFIGDVLIPVKRLINGTSIAQVPVDEVTYYHVELPRHAVILAEGLPAESYLDTGDRSNFANGGGGPIALYPDFSSRIWDAEGCAPLVITGPQLNAARRWVNGLAGRAILAA